MPEPIALNEASKEQAVTGIRILWPYLTFTERWLWVEHMMPILGTNLEDTIKELMGDA